MMDTAKTLARSGWRALQDERYEQGRAAFARAVALAPTMRDYWNGYAVALAHLKRNAEACDALQRSLKLDPLAVDVWCIHGELSLERGDRKSAAEAFARCMALDPRAEHPSGLRARALVMRAAQRY